MITLDIEMPVMNGLEALEQLMRHHPIPVVMLSSLTKEGADATIRALELGAFDFVTKPSGPISLDIHKVAEGLVERVKAGASARGSQRRSPFIPRPAAAVPPSVKATPPVTATPPAPTPSLPRTAREHLGGKVSKLVALGTSTGGPKALQTVLTALPADLPAGIVIVQHMPPGFTKSLAQRLDSLCAIHVTEAEDGQTIQPGTAYIAPGGYHMEVGQNDGKLTIHLNQAEPKGGHRPSVDVLFESVSR
ncbi:response regulator, partial [Microbacteriaceae bacterium K1510]|nr:response regulator [Microbacteriaceae bacterium K1510]